MKILNTRKIRGHKLSTEKTPLLMLTCYDYQTACLLDETELDLILVGDSLGNVILGYENTIKVSLQEMIIFSAAVKRGAKNKFVVADLPFGTYSTFDAGIKNATKLFQRSAAEAIKLEGAFDHQLKIIKCLTQTGIPVMGHIGLTPQSVHEMGGYYTHGKNQESANNLKQQALSLQEAGAFAIVLECVKEAVATEITQLLHIPTIGIGSGDKTDGQVLVINDLLKMGQERPPSFVQPISDLYTLKKSLISDYIHSFNTADHPITAKKNERLDIH